MPRLKITKNTTYDPGHLGRLLADLGSGPVMDHGDGTVTTILSDAQLEAYHRKGGSPHKVEVLPDVDPPSAVASTDAASESEQAPRTAGRYVPTLEEVIAAGYSEDVAKKIIAQAAGKTEEPMAENEQQQGQDEQQEPEAAPAPAVDQPADPGNPGDQGGDPGIIGGTNDEQVQAQPPADLPPAA